MPPSSWYPIYELLTRHGIDHDVARPIAINEFRSWELDDLAVILKRIKRPSRDYCYFRNPYCSLSTEAIDFKKWWPSLWSDTRVKWISPPRTMMELSVRDKAAICVNEAGEWSLRKSGYVALSHVWVEGLQRNNVHDGVEEQKFKAIFDLLKTRQINAAWVWTDVLAIPAGGGPASTPEDEELTIDIINNLPQIYTQADAVIIIDALVLQLHPEDAVDVAVGLTCGHWGTRVWTFQEIKLATNAVVLTATATYSFRSIVAVVKALADKDYDRFHELWLRLAIMEKNENTSLSIPDIVMASSTRKSGQDIDYARAFFPVLGLKWEYGMTREQGMQKIYKSDKRHATRIACYYGAPRMSIEPCWAPTYFHGLEGYVTEPMEWEGRGIRGEWYAVNVTKVLKTFRNGGRFVFNLYVAKSDNIMQCACAPSEDEKVCRAFETAVGRGSCYVLSAQPSSVAASGEWARTAILVEAAEVNSYDGFEVAVFCAAIIPSRSQHLESKRTVLIRHGNALDEDLKNLLRYFWHTQKEGSRPADLPRQEGESELHAAVRSGNLTAVIHLTENQNNIATFDSRGWTPLHIAAARGETEILEYLLKQKPNIEVSGRELDSYAPLSLAAEYGKVESIRLLLRYGADINARDHRDYTPIMVAAKATQSEVVKVLLESGANPNDEAEFSGTPLLLASGAGSLPTLQVLIEGGANPKPPHSYGQNPMHNAINYGSVEEIAFLIEHGCEIDGVTTADLWTPLHYAIHKKKDDYVQLLLDAGADPNKAVKEDWRPVHFAAVCGNRKVMGLLLERNPDVNVQTAPQGRTALHLACAAKDLTMAKLLTKAGADPNIKDKDGKLALELIPP